MSATIDIVNIRGEEADGSGNGEADIRAQIAAGLSKPIGQKSLPSMLLYDERGLQLYEDITTKATEYYLFAAEEEILKNYAGEIVDAMHAHGGVKAGENVVELGAGALGKTSHILSALASLAVPSSVPLITYYALDLEERELVRTLEELNGSDVGERIHGRIATRGLCATYDEGIRFIRRGGLHDRGQVDVCAQSADRLTPRASHNDRGRATSDEHLPLHLLFLGSSLGNFSRDDEAKFLRSLPLRVGCGDTLLLGLDRDNDPTVIEMAYNDPDGVNRAFVMNGLRNAGRVLGDEDLFADGKWAHVGKYNMEERRHEASVQCLEQQTIAAPIGDTFSFESDELIRIANSHKHSDIDSQRLFRAANLQPIRRWTDSAQRYSLWLLERSPSIPSPSL